MKAFAYSSGVIGFGDRCGNGAIELARTVSDSKAAVAKFKNTIEVLARHGHKKDVLLVPGVPEAANQEDGLDALIHFKKMLKTRFALSTNPAGVVVR